MSIETESERRRLAVRFLFLTTRLIYCQIIRSKQKEKQAFQQINDSRLSFDSGIFYSTGSGTKQRNFQNKACHLLVQKNNADFFVEATEKTIKLKKGTSISYTVPGMNQGIITVKAKVGNEWIQGEILLDDTTCN